MKYTEYFETSRGSPLRLIYTHFTWSREEMRGTHFLLLDSDNSIYLVFITLNILNFDASPVQWQGVYPFFSLTHHLFHFYIQRALKLYSKKQISSAKGKDHTKMTDGNVILSLATSQQNLQQFKLHTTASNRSLTRQEERNSFFPWMEIPPKCITRCMTYMHAARIHTASVNLCYIWNIQLFSLSEN